MEVVRCQRSSCQSFAQIVIARIPQEALPQRYQRRCYAIAEMLAGSLAPTLSGATHYYAEWMPTPPTWASHPKARLVATRYGHMFFAGVP